MSRKQRGGQGPTKRQRRAKWDDDDMRKLYHYRVLWQIDNPGEIFRPMHAFGEKLFPHASDKQIHSFVNSPKFLNYVADHEHETLGGSVTGLLKITLLNKI